MKKIFLRLSAGFVLGFSLVLVSSVAQATTPTLSVSGTGNSDSVILTVYGDPYSTVTLYRQDQSYNYGSQSQYIGTTNSSGYFTSTISSGNYGVAAGSSVYVIVNNQMSSSVIWPYGYNNYNYSSPTLSQTSISVMAGQSVDVSIYGGNAPYTMYNSGSNIFQAVISGNKIQVAGLANGSGSINICSSGGTGSGCVILYVTVNSNSYYNMPVQPAVTFTQTSPTLYVGQSVTIGITGGNSYNYYGSSYNVAYNSNSSLVSASISGNSLIVQGLANGNASIVVCSTSANCTALNVGVGSTSYNNSGNWAQCGNEGQFCAFQGSRNVRYGANGVYIYKVLYGGVNCSNTIFGDPIFGVAKTCSISQ